MTAKVFIVSAHPEPQSFSAAMARTAADVFRAQGAQVRQSDLYAMGFNPVAGATDFGSRRDSAYLNYPLEQRFNAGQATLAPDIVTELDGLRWCDLLILNFPIWWCSVPAILKGWIDRVLVSGECYGGTRFYDRGGLVGKRAMLAFSIGAQPHMFAADGVHGDLEAMLRPLQRGTLAYVGFTVLPPFAAWHIPYITPAAREEMMVRYRDHLLGLDTLTPLAMPSLTAFDSRLHPLAAGKDA